MGNKVALRHSDRLGLTTSSEDRGKKNCYEHKRIHSSHEGDLSQSIDEHGWNSLCSPQYG